MTNKEIEQVKAREQRASPGPWPVRRIPNLYKSNAGDRQTHPAVRGLRAARRLYEQAAEQIERDFDFISHAREDVPKLIEEIERLRGKLRECRSALLNMTHDDPSISPKPLVLVSLIVEHEERRWDLAHGTPNPAQSGRWREALAEAES